MRADVAAYSGSKALLCAKQHDAAVLVRLVDRCAARAVLAGGKEITSCAGAWQGA